MLVLSRRVNESIVIDGKISITVLSAHPGRVRLGITAPDEVAIDRAEICHRLNGASPPRVDHQYYEPSLKRSPRDQTS